ncbi:hypothetical protein Tco_1514212, partial [Tanacetum coccineum]
MNKSRSGRCKAQNHINTETNESRTSRQQQTKQQIQTNSSRFKQQTKQQIQTADLDSGKQNHPNKRGKTRQHPMQNEAKRGKPDR